MELTDFEPLLVDFYSMSPIHMVSPRKLLFEGFFFFLHACFQYDIEKEKERLCINSMIFIVRVTQFYSQCIVIVKKNQIRFSVPCHISHTKGVDNSTQITLLTSETQFVLLILTPAQYNKAVTRNTVGQIGFLCFLSLSICCYSSQGSTIGVTILTSLIFIQLMGEFGYFLFIPLWMLNNFALIYL